MQMEDKKLSTGTTTVGLAYKDGVVLATDTKSTLGYLISSKEAQKVFQIDDNMALTIAGSVGDAQTLIRIIKAEIKLYKLSRNSEISVNSVKTLLSNIMQGSRYYPYMTMLILGGVDKAGAHVHSIDPVGGAEEDRYTSTGSGSPMAYGILEDGYKDNMTREEAINLAMRAIKSSRERDIFSGGNRILFAVIDKGGVKMFDSETMKEHMK